MEFRLSLPLAGVLASLLSIVFAAEPANPKPIVVQPGDMLVLVAPEYPKDALARQETSRIDISATIRRDGSLADIRLAASPESASLVKAVDDVIRFWRLMPGVTSESCTFSEIPASISLWFEIEKGSPKVSYSRPVREPPTIHPIIDGTDASKRILRRVAPKYPRDVLRIRNAPERVHQHAFVAVRSDGTVESVQLAPMRYHRTYERAIVEALQKWEFTPSPAPWCGQLAIEFVIE